jgi:hypothetical protein
MNQFNNRHLIITHADDPSGKDPVAINARCYWEVIESRSILPEEIITTSTTTIKGDRDDVTIDDHETSSASTTKSDRAVKRSRIESLLADEEATVIVHEHQPVLKSRNCYSLIFHDTTGPHDMLSRTTVKQDGMSYVTIEVTLVSKIHEGSFINEAVVMGDEESLKKTCGYLPHLKELFKQLFEEIVDYLDDNEAELFLINVINDMINMIGRGSIYLNAAVRELDALYLATGNSVKREEWKQETDRYFKWTFNAFKEHIFKEMEEHGVKMLKEEAAKSGEEVTHEKELC